MSAPDCPLTRAKNRALVRLKSKHEKEYDRYYVEEMNAQGWIRVPRGVHDRGGKGPFVWKKLDDVDNQLGRTIFNRVLSHLDDDEVEFLRDEFVLVGERHPNYPREADLEAFDYADLAHDELELRKYGRIVSSVSTTED